MRNNRLVLLVLVVSVFTGCRGDIREATNQVGFSAADINGIWKDTATGAMVRISGVDLHQTGTGTVYAMGTALPSSALGGICIKEVEFIRAGYWEAYHQQFTGGSWQQTRVIGLTMKVSKSELRMGDKVYSRR
ncbi:hypothetical protein [Sediminibacterium soli]|uniref:hypothetical protein n=1 Tax=Sediminibacterium soli TaxID=2698829 RepID=UPI00137B844E|nr:hypothetical protein [Sediminibacterium soli]NCI46516.1 hypothetical protein [Sediminibacterium soli]